MKVSLHVSISYFLKTTLTSRTSPLSKFHSCIITLIARDSVLKGPVKSSHSPSTHRRMAYLETMVCNIRLLYLIALTSFSLQTQASQTITLIKPYLNTFIRGDGKLCCMVSSWDVPPSGDEPDPSFISLFPASLLFQPASQCNDDNCGQRILGKPSRWNWRKRLC